MSAEKLAKVRRQAAALTLVATQHRRWVPKQELASFIGFVVSLSIAMPLARFHLLPLYDSLNSKL